MLLEAMRYERPLIEGRLLGRYKRFLSEVELPGLGVVVAHCPNPGSMATCAPEGARVWLSQNDSPRRKLRYTWELVEVDGEMVMVHPGRANDLVAEALKADRVAELRGYERVRREVRCGETSRLDFLLERAHARCFVEVKSVTLDLGEGISAFPDAVTARGRRHLEALGVCVAAGDRAALLFCASRAGSREVRPADHIDPAYGEALRRAAKFGVELLAYRCEVAPEAVWLRESIPVVLP